jgi:diaminopimelate decarboxylase
MKEGTIYMHTIEKTENIAALYSQPPESLFELAKKVKTPAMIYDYQGMKDVVDRIQEDLSLVKNAKLNIAVKATHTPHLLELYAKWGLGGDVASIGEYRLAKKAGFKEITTTSPAYTVEDIEEFQREEITMDLDSISQIELYGKHFPNNEIGLRIRIPLPEELESEATFGRDSRFGIDILNPKLPEVLEQYSLTVTRLHVHTGQMTPESLIYKGEYLLAIAEVFPQVHTIDYGGGLFHFYIDRVKTRRYLKIFNELILNWQNTHNRKIHTRFEPGGALLAGCGYLVTSVLSKEYQKFFGSEVLTVNSSAWNLAPWHKPQVIALDTDDAETAEYLIAGNTLYEGDFFGKDTNGKMMSFKLPNSIRVGSCLLFTASGAYTMTNSRLFNRIPLPEEYILKEDQLVKVVRGHGYE